MNTKVKLSKILSECSILLAFSIILTIVKLVNLPYGGSITLGAILPIVIISYRFGFKWGTLSGIAFGVIELLLTIGVLSYVTGWQSIVAVIILDYILAFGFFGLSAIFRKIQNQTIAMLIGVLFTSFIRYLCHVISGCTVWAGLSIPTSYALVYSLGYNATYMIPETIVACILIFYISNLIDFKSEKIRFNKKTNFNKSFLVPFYVDTGIVVAILVYALVNIFKVLQDSETGDFIFTNISNVNWISIGLFTFIALIVGLLFTVIYVIITNNRRKQQ